jgi:hypothetical protein
MTDSELEVILAKCNSDWRDLSAGPPFKREIGQSHGDRTVAYTCPDCGHVVPRRF